MPAKLLIQCALDCEAKPIIQAYKLQLIAKQPFRLYKNSDDSLYMIISGIGKINAAAACSYLFAISGQHSYSLFINLGIAGSRNRQVGDIFFAHKIIDATTGDSFYPNPHIIKRLASLPLITCHHAQEELIDDTLVDMEASSFFSTAKRCVNQEQIHCLKIISDNQEQPFSRLNANIISELITQQLSVLKNIISYCTTMSQQESCLLPDTLLLAQITNSYHFTVSQQHQLQDLVRRWQVQKPQQALVLTQFNTGRELMEYLKEQLRDANDIS